MSLSIITLAQPFFNQAQRFLLLLLLLTALLAFCSHVPAWCAQQANSLTIAESIARLENLAGIEADDQLALPERLSVVERKVLGSPQQGPLVGRIDRLQRTLRAEPPQSASWNSSFREHDLSEIEESLPGGGSPLADSLPLLNALPPNFLRIEAPGAQAGGDYTVDATKNNHGKILRFKTMPVPVFINQFPDRQFVACVVRGFETWEDRTSGAVRFVQVDDPAKARIQVAWKRLGRAEDKSGCTLGAHTITKYTSNGRGSVSLLNVSGVPIPVYIPKFGPKYTVPPQVIEVNLDLIMSKSPNVRYRLLQNVVTHELGHALGLLGHSPNINDMMYPVTDEHSRLSERDINTLIKIYKQKVDVPL